MLWGPSGVPFELMGPRWTSCNHSHHNFTDLTNWDAHVYIHSHVFKMVRDIPTHTSLPAQMNMFNISFFKTDPDFLRDAGLLLLGDPLGFHFGSWVPVGPHATTHITCSVAGKKLGYTRVHT